MKLHTIIMRVGISDLQVGDVIALLHPTGGDWGHWQVESVVDVDGGYLQIGFDEGRGTITGRPEMVVDVVVRTF